MKIYHVKEIVCFSLLLCLSACANVNNSWVLDRHCVTSLKTRQQQYRIKLETPQANSVQFLVINSWQDGALASTGVNPLGIKLYSASWREGEMVMEINPLYKKINFQAILQSLLLSNIVGINGVYQDSSCIDNSGFNYKREGGNGIFTLGNEVILTFLQVNNSEKEKTIILHNDSYTLGVKEI